MRKIIGILFLLVVLFLLPNSVYAAGPNFITVVNPIRGSDFWDLSKQKPVDGVKTEMDILNKTSVPATWLVRFDALGDQTIIGSLKSTPNGEVGLFLEITPSLTKAAGVVYNQSTSWHSAQSVFLTGYSQTDRIKMIDTAFAGFKNTFGFYPKSVGAWWIDSYSLEYMRNKYNISADLIVSDQYSTDNYQIWGQYFSTPYYGAKRNALIPAQSPDQKIGPLTLQWAPRDPFNSYGKGVEESTYSIQPNDYIDYHNLDSSYFEKVIDTYLNQKFNRFNQLVVGLENSYDLSKYGSEYQKQINILNQKRQRGELSLVTMSQFADWYGNNFSISPPQLIVADDPLGTDQKVLWYMNPYYRVGWFYNREGSEIRDIRAYVAGSTEICFNDPCSQLNFALTAIRSLDDVTFNQRYLLDQGTITDFNVAENSDSVNFSYKNAAGTLRQIALLPRDISIDGDIKSIDTTILKAQTLPQINKTYSLASDPVRALKYQEKPIEIILNIFKIIALLIFAIFIPGLLLSRKILVGETAVFKVFISSAVGLVLITLTPYVLGYFKAYSLIYIFIILCNLIFFAKFRPNFKKPNFSVSALCSILILFAGVAFQSIPTFKSGFIYDFGIGFWGPNAHDGVWHISLINQLLSGLPPQNPILSGTILKNYHYLFDLLVAAGYVITKIPVSDLLFRFFPPMLSLLIGIGTYLLADKLFKSKLAANIALYLSFFCGSFGWIVDYIHQKSLNGESAFWANQSISLNLNPPYAISVILVITIFLLFMNKNRNLVWSVIMILLAGSLFGFKSYAGMLILGSFGVVGLLELRRGNIRMLLLTALSGLLTLLIFLPNFTPGTNFFVFDPFWLVHSIIDFPDRVGWSRLSSARLAYQARGQWPKFILVEIIGLLLFVLGNLGIRVFGFLGIFKSKVEKRDLLALLSIFTLASIIIPLLFVQVGTPWNIIQFFYYFMFVLTLFAGLGLSNLFKILPKPLSLVALIAILLIAPINSVVVARGYLQYSPHTFISFDEYDALQFLAKSPKGVVLAYPYDARIKDKMADPRPLFVYDTTSYVSAFSGQPVFIEDETQNDILQTSYKPRLVAENDFFREASNVNLTDFSLAKLVSFLHNNHVNYVYIPKYFNIRLNEKLPVKNVFENKEIVIYQIL